MGYGIWDIFCAIRTPIFYIQPGGRIFYIRFALRSSCLRQIPPISERRLEKVKSPDNIGLDKLTGAVDGAVDVAFGGEVHDRVRLILFEYLL